MLLDGRTRVIYGGGGAIGGAVARAFAREGARVHLAGRTPAPLERVAEQVRAAGGVAETAAVDALDERAVDQHADAVAAAAGAIDICFNLISIQDVQGTPLVEMSPADFERPVVTAVRSMFLTSRAAARHMLRQGSGVILVFGGYAPPAARLPPRRPPGRLPGHGGPTAQPGRRARAARHPRADPADRRGAGDHPAGRRQGDAAGHRRHGRGDEVSAASRALDQVGFKILACGLRVYARDQQAAERAGYTEEELEKLFLQLA